MSTARLSGGVEVVQAGDFKRGVMDVPSGAGSNGPAARRSSSTPAAAIGLITGTTAGVDTGFVREPGGTLNSMTHSGKAYYYLTDALGSVVALTDESGTKVNTYAYSPRGVTRSTTTEKAGVSQPYRFTNCHQDPTGLSRVSTLTEGASDVTKAV